VARTRVVIDTDPGVDDAVAILLALARDELDVLALTTVAGNVAIDKTTLNARRLVDLSGRRDVLVARGAARPLAGVAGDASEVHGADGLGDQVWDEPRTPETDETAVELLGRLADEGPLTVIAIGPLTNLATALARDPLFDTRVERLVVMGGASFQGNVTPAAEFNIWSDPEAAVRVFAGRWPITVLPLDLTHQAVLRDDDLAFLRGLGTRVGERCAQMLEPYAAYHERWYANRDIIMHDAAAVYAVLDPSAITTQGVTVAVETGGEHSRGATWFDRRRAHENSTTRVGVSLDPERFRAVLRESLARYA
jgi:inosine-uridine nucleoside N-ribohydrolase